jgi:hypothetical protein
MALVDLEVHMLEVMLEGVASGEYDGQGLTVLAVAISAMIDGAEEFIPLVTPPLLLVSQWDDVVEDHARSREVFGRWSAQTISAQEAIDELGDAPELCSASLGIAQTVLTSVYGYDPGFLATTEREIMDLVRNAFPPTPEQ